MYEELHSNHSCAFSFNLHPCFYWSGAGYHFWIIYNVQIFAHLRIYLSCLCGVERLRFHDMSGWLLDMWKPHMNLYHLNPSLYSTSAGILGVSAVILALMTEASLKHNMSHTFLSPCLTRCLRWDRHSMSDVSVQPLAAFVQPCHICLHTLLFLCRSPHIWLHKRAPECELLLHASLYVLSQYKTVDVWIATKWCVSELLFASAWASHVAGPWSMPLHPPTVWRFRVTRIQEGKYLCQIMSDSWLKGSRHTLPTYLLMWISTVLWIFLMNTDIMLLV